MKKINPPNVNDVEELQLLANNSRLGSYPDLMGEYIQFRRQYKSYIDCGGDPWTIAPLTISDRLRKALLRHYESSPEGRLEFIDRFRRNLLPTFCPMCGGFGNGTIDHYLPKSAYPEYSFFSKNLIPACNCNSLRGTEVRGLVSPQRAIHPYYDDFMDKRLYKSAFEGDFETPIISIEVLDQGHPKIALLQFHLDTVITNDATQGWFEKYWSDLAQRAHHLLAPFLPPSDRPVTEAALMDTITKFRDYKDIEHDTPNNWHSIFYTGLMADYARIKRLASRINESRH